jgi:thiol-disulfide isomerase/thioredoxin
MSSQPGATSVPTLGAEPPEVVAKEWLNAEGPRSLAELKGQVVLVEFWATWCGPCVAGIPHMNELNAKHSGDGLRILSFTDESRSKVDRFQKSAKVPIEYTIGVGSTSSQTYRVTGIPHAFLIGRNGKLLWEGHPAMPACEENIVKALAMK